MYICTYMHTLLHLSTDETRDTYNGNTLFNIYHPPPSPPFRYYHHTVKVLILSVVLCWIGLMCTVIHLMEAGKSGWTSSSGFFKVVGELCFHASTAMLILLGMLLAKGMCITS